MSLQVWLPTNKDFRNAGLNGSKITNSSVIFSASGPTNGSMCFNGSNYIDLNYNMSNLEEFTISMFVYCTGTTFAGNLFTIERSSYWQFIIYNGTLQWRDNVIGYSGTRKSYTLPTVTANKWNHLCITFYKGTVTVYLNGNKHGSASGDGTKLNDQISHFWVGHCSDGYWFTGYVSDLRVYNNTLTEDDIKNLCKIKIFDLVPYKDGIRGGVLFDRSGYCLSAVTPYNLSYKNSCAVFNGTNSSIQIPPMTQINSGGLFTMNVWFLKSSFGSKGWETIFGGPGGFELETKRSTTQSPVIVPYNWGGGSSVTTYDMPYNLNKWVMVSMVRNASNCKFFINGELKYTGSRGSIPSGNYFIGSWSTTSSQNFKGNVSNFKLFRKDLTDEEIAELYEQEKEMFLPDDYEELEYIESNTGQTCYINTGVKLNNSNFNKLRIEIDGNFGTDTTHWRVDGFSGSIGGVFVTRYIGINPSSKLAYGNQSDTATSLTDSDTTGRHSYIVDYKNGYVKKDGNTIVTFTPHVYTHTFETNLFIFTWNTSGTKQKSAKKYGVKFFFDDVLTFNGIPSKRKSDNVIGMYDMVSRQFFTNAGTGSFSGE